MNRPPSKNLNADFLMRNDLMSFVRYSFAQLHAVEEFVDRSATGTYRVRTKGS